ncbi:archaeosine biosynthesis radical SAM protein RaSEA [Methanocella conradii]|uniref:archaeosine biosynthesis radical SAM protein RaSEA n=1 Tax=Methanocella conradii TaxID=1175444 RepID=UPI00157DEE3A|nr:archaeosine biosynthesis radical SAM protein RaSEA [Methanocella conradii]
MMENLGEVMMEIRRRQRMKPRMPTELVGFWKGEDLLDSKPVRSNTIVFRTRGCYWAQKGGCTMCGYTYDAAITPPTADDLIAQYRSVEDRIDGSVVKLFTSGSFLDKGEVPEKARDEILSSLSKKASKVIVETRPEFVTDKALDEAKKYVERLEVAIGLETSSDKIRIECINKNFLFMDFVNASETAKRHGVTTKAYLLLKPPFIDEKDALDDMVKSVLDAAPYAGTISINLCNVQRGTIVDELFRKKAYRPPWLWTIVEIIRRVHGKTGAIIMSDPLAAGSPRGPHNCYRCDHAFADAIRKYSITQDISVFDRLGCECRASWEKVLELEAWTFGAPLIY